VRGDELFTDLLESLSAALGYPFDRVQLSQGIYYPRAHGEAERRREVAERAFLEVLVGNRALAMKVIEFPASDEAFNLQMRLQERLLSAIERGAIRVKNVKGGGGPDSIA
jgi:hypothetical protein